ncbi:MAG TPA: response regulator transcription factor [Symbiobacteriaceae bacterium]|nr:response regulator transcription factor [Symbiobacteriaceae bacterium]
MSQLLRVLVVDDHEVVRVGVRRLLERQSELAVVGEAGTVAEAVAVAREVQPDMVVMDMRLPDGDGVEACRMIRSERPQTKVLMLTSYTDDDAVFSAIMAGATGYLLKQTRGQVLVDAILTAGAGGSLLDPSITKQVLDRIRGGSSAAERLAGLSDQEQRILDLISRGLTNREIAYEIYLSEKTVRNYVSQLLHKLNVSRRSEAAAMAARFQPPLRTAVM